MSHIPRLTMIGLYNYDDRLFDDMTLPAGVNKATFINSFLLKYGEAPVIYPRYDFMKTALKFWSQKWYDSIERIIRAETEDYNPLHNFDRYEEYNDTTKVSGKNTLKNSEKAKDTRTTTSREDSKIQRDAKTTNNTDQENTVSAYNADTYQPDTKQTTDSTGQTNETSTGYTGGEEVVKGNNDITRDTTGTSSEDRSLDHTGHLYGNIGVTKSQDMLVDEINVRMNYNLYDVLSELLYREVCLYLY